jgi:dienelactone hydrolase
MKPSLLSLFLVLAVPSVRAAPALTVTPAEALIVDEVRIALHGFAPAAAVTLRVRMRDDLDRRWENAVELTVNAAGGNDFAPGGLFAAMRLDPAAGDRSPFSKRGVGATVCTLHAEIDGREVAWAQLTRRFVASDVTRLPVREAGIVGTLFLPPPAKRTGVAVVTIGGSEGGLREDRAAVLASHGVTALALAYFGFEDLPKALAEIPLETFERGVAYVTRQPGVDPARLFMLGSSRGAEGALLAASRIPAIRGVIALAPGNTVNGPFGAETRGARSAWTWRGEPLAHLGQVLTPDQQTRLAALRDKPGGATWADVLAIRWENPAALEPILIPVEKIAGPMLLLAGEDDQLWPAAAMARALHGRLAEREFPHGATLRVYPDSGHAFPWPNLPTTVVEWKHPVSGARLQHGGKPEGVARAAVEAWREILRFLAVPSRDSERDGQMLLR